MLDETRVQDGRARFGCSLADWWGHPLLATAQGPLARLGPHLPMDQVADLPPLQARIYEGAWIVECPCGGADFVWLEMPLLRCSSCGNRYSEGRWRRVEIPPQHTRIETALNRRPDPTTRNWQPGETVAKLLAENAEHGL